MLRRHARSIVLGVIALLCIGSGRGADPPAAAAHAETGSSPSAGSGARAAFQSLNPVVIASRGNPDLELPAFLPGMWEYRRTQLSSAGGKPQTATIRKCSDPSAEFKRKLAQLKQRGCLFNPLKQNGKQYEASWRCTAADGAVLAMRDVITVNSERSYQNDSEAFVSQQATHSTIVANRQGDCGTAALPAAPARQKTR